MTLVKLCVMGDGGSGQQEGEMDNMESKSASQRSSACRHQLSCHTASIGLAIPLNHATYVCLFRFIEMMCRTFARVQLYPLLYYMKCIAIAWRLFHLIGIGVRSDSLASHSGDNVDVPPVVLHALLRASPGLLLLLLGLDLGGLALHFTGTSERSVDFSHGCK